MSRIHGLGLLLMLEVFAVSASGQEVNWRPAQNGILRQPPPTRSSYVARGVAADDPTGPILPAVPPAVPPASTLPASTLPPLPAVPPVVSPPTRTLMQPPSEPTGPILPPAPLPPPVPSRLAGPALPPTPQPLSLPDMGGVPPMLRDAGPCPLPGSLGSSAMPPRPIPPLSQAVLLSNKTTTTPAALAASTITPTTTTTPAALSRGVTPSTTAQRPLWPTTEPASTGEVWSPVTRVSYQPEPSARQMLPDLPGKVEQIGPPRDPVGKPDPTPSVPSTPPATTPPPAPTTQAHHDDLWRAAPTVVADSAGAAAGAGQRFWLRGEYLLWTVKPDQIPVLATTGPIGTFGFLGQPGVVPLLGPGDFNDGVRHGWRISGGVWLDDCMTCGLDFSVFALPRVSERAEFNSAQFPVLTRPIFALNFNQEFGELVANPGIADGALVVDHTSDLWGFDVNAFETLCCWCGLRANAFAGIRYLQLHETLRIQEFLVAGPNALTEPLGTNIIVTDNFDTRNQFLGGQIGMNVERRWGNVIGEFRGKLAFGGTRQTLRIDGSQFRRRPGEAPVVVTNGGLLATPTNIGEFQRDRFSFVPEFFVSLGYQFTPNLRVFAGYNFLYWTNVIRPGSEVDRVVDLAFVPNTGLNVPPTGINRPAPQFRDVDFWAQGLSLGAELRW